MLNLHFGSNLTLFFFSDNAGEQTLEQKINSSGAVVFHASSFKNMNVLNFKSEDDEEEMEFSDMADAPHCSQYKDGSTLPDEDLSDAPDCSTPPSKSLDNLNVVFEQHSSDEHSMSRMYSPDAMNGGASSLNQHTMPYSLRRKSTSVKHKSTSVSPSLLDSKIITNNVTVSASIPSTRSILDSNNLYVRNGDKNSFVKIYPSSSCSDEVSLEDSSLHKLNSNSSLMKSQGSSLPVEPSPSVPSTPGPSQGMAPSTVMPLNLKETPSRSHLNSFVMSSLKNNNLSDTSNSYGSPRLIPNSFSNNNEIVEHCGSLNLSSRKSENLSCIRNSNLVSSNGDVLVYKIKNK